MSFLYISSSISLHLNTDEVGFVEVKQLVLLRHLRLSRVHCLEAINDVARGQDRDSRAEIARVRHRAEVRMLYHLGHGWTFAVVVGELVKYPPFSGHGVPIYLRGAGSLDILVLLYSGVHEMNSSAFQSAA